MRSVFGDLTTKSQQLHWSNRFMILGLQLEAANTADTRKGCPPCFTLPLTSYKVRKESWAIRPVLEGEHIQVEGWANSRAKA